MDSKWQQKTILIGVSASRNCFKINVGGSEKGNISNQFSETLQYLRCQRFTRTFFMVEIEAFDGYKAGELTASRFEARGWK